MTLAPGDDGPEARRDLEGYRDAEPAPWPEGPRLAVSIVVNVEEGAELSIGDGDERNESLHEIREEVEGDVDPCMETHFAYGPRAGYRRVRDALGAAGARATFSCCGRAATRVPWLLREAAGCGHEIACHGWRWERHAGMEETRERALIARTHAAVATASGIAPRGWHTRSAPSANTRRLLVEHGGFAYDSDAYDDDVPYHVTLARRSHVVLPYAFDTNDMRFAPGAGFVHAEDFARYTIAAFDRLLREGASACRMLSIGLHLRTIGRPARIGGLETLLEHIRRHDEARCMTRGEIAAAWRRHAGLPPWRARS